MRGAPQSGFASAMVRTRSASSEPTRGRPARPRRDFQVQKARKPCRCQRITVSGRTRWSASRHPAHWLESHTQRRRSRHPNCGRFDRRRSKASCCRSAKFSSVRSVRVLSAARRAPNTASTRDIAVHGSHTARQASSLASNVCKRQLKRAPDAFTGQLLREFLPQRDSVTAVAC